jgi:hypothetical protein
MKDIIEIKENKIIVRLTFTVEQLDSAYMGYIPSFDIPFTSPNQETAGEIASGLINALFNQWLKKGNLELVKEKLELFKFSKYSLSSDDRFEHIAPLKSIRMKEKSYAF